VSAADRKVLEGWLRMPTLSQALGLRARIVLSGAGSTTVRGVALGLGVSPNTVAACRARYGNGGVEGLRTRPARRASAPNNAGQGAGSRQRDAAQAQDRHPLERASLGQGGRAFAGHGAPHLAEVRASTAPG
jgi:hypothetical protein